MSKYIILTVPHSYCLQHTNYRICDKRSLESADILSNKLKNKNPNIKIILYPNEEMLRSECDMNRPTCRDTHYRENLDNLINTILSRGDSISWILDMHSFPYYSSWYTWYRKNDYKIVFLYLLQSPFKEYKIFHNNLQSYREIGFIEGSLYNDIILTSIQKGIKSILIESLEDHELFPNNEIDKYFDIIGEIILNNI